MRFGITSSGIDDVGYIAHAEQLGYDFCWVPDTQLLMSNPFAVLALAAQQTRRIRIGTGLAIAGLRLAPVTANGIVTINRLARGRVFLGIGTGNTAMRTMGQPPMATKPFREHLRVIRALLHGEEVDYTLNGVTHPIRFQNRHLGQHDGPPVPIHVGGFGPRSQALAGELGDGLITGIPRGGTVPQALANVARGAARAGRSLEGFETTALVNLLMLEPGETLADDRVIAECGPAIMANVHYLVDLHKETGKPPPDYVLPIWEEYLAFHRTRDAERAHQQLHQSHYTYLERDEARFVTPQIVRTFCLAGQPGEIVERLKELESQGLDAINFILPPDRQYRVTEDFARRVMARM
jgi:alkanesulfonate monooxygenase SsuD/methylene tetrahydromethanopterin reductase-like flavin-dependent oxidoreductase (luciferase family)